METVNEYVFISVNVANFWYCFKIMISFPNSTLPPSFVVKNSDYIDFDWYRFMQEPQFCDESFQTIPSCNVVVGHARHTHACTFHRITGICRSFVVHTSISHLYTSTAVPTSTSAVDAALVTGNCLDHQNIRTNHF